LRYTILVLGITGQRNFKSKNRDSRWVKVIELKYFWELKKEDRNFLTREKSKNSNFKD